MTVYVKELLMQLNESYGDLSADKLGEKLFEIGVIDHTLCKVLAVRKYVDNLVMEGEGKIDAMWVAMERFCCSYEYVRKCMYYYKDVNME